ncbi:GD17865 [Drosophila simulans]|uniref:GD17865 n=1 Tax=Drosophila simulans TaxID=7240 RepID=B4NU04_DROSI|nr:GD17865 [Drosophila simulans]
MASNAPRRIVRAKDMSPDCIRTIAGTHPNMSHPTVRRSQNTTNVLFLYIYHSICH